MPLTEATRQAARALLEQTAVLNHKILHDFYNALVDAAGYDDVNIKDVRRSLKSLEPGFFFENINALNSGAWKTLHERCLMLLEQTTDHDDTQLLAQLLKKITEEWIPSQIALKKEVAPKVDPGPSILDSVLAAFTAPKVVETPISVLEGFVKNSDKGKVKLRPLYVKLLDLNTASRDEAAAKEARVLVNSLKDTSQQCNSETWTQLHDACVKCLPEDVKGLLEQLHQEAQFRIEAKLAAERASAEERVVARQVTIEKWLAEMVKSEKYEPSDENDAIEAYKFIEKFINNIHSLSDKPTTEIALALKSIKDLLDTLKEDLKDLTEDYGKKFIVDYYKIVRLLKPLVSSNTYKSIHKHPLTFTQSELQGRQNDMLGYIQNTALIQLHSNPNKLPRPELKAIKEVIEAQLKKLQEAIDDFDTEVFDVIYESIKEAIQPGILAADYQAIPNAKETEEQQRKRQAEEETEEVDLPHSESFHSRELQRQQESESEQRPPKDEEEDKQAVEARRLAAERRKAQQTEYNVQRLESLIGHDQEEARRFDILSDKLARGETLSQITLPSSQPMSMPQPSAQTAPESAPVATLSDPQRAWLQQCIIVGIERYLKKNRDTHSLYHTDYGVIRATEIKKRLLANHHDNQLPITELYNLVIPSSKFCGVAFYSRQPGLTKKSLLPTILGVMYDRKNEVDNWKELFPHFGFEKPPQMMNHRELNKVRKKVQKDIYNEGMSLLPYQTRYQMHRAKPKPPPAR